MKLQSCAKTLTLPLVGVALLTVVFFTLGRYRGRQPWATPAAFSFSVGEHQISLGLDAGFSTAPAVVPALLDEITAVWGLPLGQRVEVCFKGGQRSAVTGTLILLRAPDYPWDRLHPLQLSIAGLVFSSRDIERWTAI
jgi:hypothetical protein